MSKENITKNVIEVKAVTKSFKIPLESSNGIKQKLINALKGRKGYRNFTPLNDISFSVKEGEFFGIVGRNGSGKSTLLKTLAGIYTPNKGNVTVEGNLVPFIELGVGFNPELTGRENIFLNGALLGFSRKEITAMYDDIVDFSELHDFMEERLKNYSSGMQVRLAFSIAIQAKGDVLLLDEVLAVGDAVFQKKCFEYFKQLKKDKKTVIFVSHDISALEEYCTNGILIENGRIITEGSIKVVLDEYRKRINNLEKSNADIASKKKTKLIHDGVGGVTIKNAFPINVDKKTPKNLFTEEDDLIDIKVDYLIERDVDDPVYEMTIYDGSGQRIFSSNTIWNHQEVTPVSKGDEYSAIWSIPNIFASGVFTISTSVGMNAGSVMLDRVEDAGKFQVSKKQYSNAYTNLNYSLKIVN